MWRTVINALAHGLYASRRILGARSCMHEGDRAVIVETTDDGWLRCRGTRCPRCGFRSMTIQDDDGNDVTDRYVVSSMPSTWARWDAHWDDDLE